MRVIISAGGTGGHIYPALAIIKKIKEMEPGSEFLYIGTKDRMEASLIPKRKIPYVGIEMKGLNRKKVWKNIKAIQCFLSGIKQAKQEIRKFNPDVVLGVGGYITAPVIYAAKKLGYKTFIHEQNCIPGLSNKFLSHYADRIGVSLEESLAYFDTKKAIFTGNPRSEEVLQVKPVDKKELGLSPLKKLVLIVMGSLGSMTMNQKMKEIIPGFASKNYEVLLVTGKNYYEKYQKELAVPSNVKLVPYLDNMLEIMKKTDLIVSRSGASTIAEITAIGLPSILVPSPYVTHNHQLKNALALEKCEAAVILEEDNFNKENLMTQIDRILNDQKYYHKMKHSAKKLGVPDSATRIYHVIKELVKEK